MMNTHNFSPAWTSAVRSGSFIQVGRASRMVGAVGNQETPTSKVWWGKGERKREPSSRLRARSVE
jgi:hypothetical protein